MPTFDSKPLGGGSGPIGSALARLTPKVRSHPFLMFGAPFMLTIVAASYGLSALTQQRYDYNASKVQTVSKEQELGMRKDRRKIDIREEYYRLQAKDAELDDWEPKRIARPEGVPEWGIAPVTNSVPPPTRQEATEGKDDKPGYKREPSLLRKVYNEEKTPALEGSQQPFSAAGARGKMVLGPDGKPCRACNSKLAFSAAMKGGKMPGTMHGQSSKDGSKAAASAAAAAAAANIPPGEEAEAIPARDCPPDGELLGSSTWTFLHSAAAYYPNNPSTEQQSAMLNLVRALPHLYPCHTCAESLGEELAREKTDKKSWEGGAVLDTAVRSGPAMRTWLCGLHNEVNARLGKPTWRCDDETQRQRWLDGPDDGSCD